MANYSTSNRNSAQVIALAGVLQSAYLVDQIARTGDFPLESYNPSINSLFQFEADSPESIYGGIHGIDLGLRVLLNILGGSNTGEYRSIIRYALGILYLQKKLSCNEELMDIIHSRLQHTSLKADHFTDNLQAVASSIASIYQDTLSHFKFRIQVSGSMQQLQNPQNVDNIRALLLAGLRAAVLWRQVGGKRWHLFISRQRLLQTARELTNR
ncbi:MAG: high frequency lysogenization protein HflD [Pseudomonadales bacterium]